MKTLILKQPVLRLTFNQRLSFFLFSLFILNFPVAHAQVNSTPAGNQLVEQTLKKKNDQTPALPSSTSSQWYNQAIAHLTEREYFFQPFGKQGLYSAANHAQHLGFLFSATGYTVKNIKEGKENEKDWTYDFKVQQVGRAHSRLSKLSLKTKNYTEKTLSYSFGNFNIEYVNDEKGMRQNFIVDKKPVGNGKLEIVISLKGNLIPSVEDKGHLLLSSLNDKKKVELTYDKLKVWDANHTLLSASMELDGKDKLVIAVDDKAAVYPVTIDPLNHTPDWTASGNGLLFPLLNDLTTPVLYGYSVANAGDVNGDGYGDILIGTPLYVKINSIAANSFNPVSVGAAFVYMGSPAGPTTTPSEVLQPSTIAGAFAGFSVSTAGDIDKDGMAEIMISAPGDRVDLSVGLGTVAVASGKVYLYEGGAFDGNVNTSTPPVSTLSLGQSDFGLLALVPANPLYGFSISNLGDTNGDGYDDIAVGSPAYLDLSTLTLGGKVDIYNGSASGIGSTPARTIKSGLLNGLFGFTVSGAGKVNNDAYNDMIVGAPASIGVLGLGKAFVFNGGPSGFTQTNASAANTVLSAPGLLNATLFGFSVSTAGDVNNDGFDDVIVGEPLSLETTLALQTVAVGKAHIFYGSSSGIQSTGETALTSPRSPNLLGLMQGNLLFGYSVSNAGDMNCDGIQDVVVGEPGGTAISLGTGALGLVSANALSGAAYIFNGKTGTGPSNIAAMTIQETSVVSAANLIGYSVSNAGDVNGDGHPDLIIGAPNGTLNLASSLTGIIGNALGYVTTNSVGSAYVYNGCFFSLLPVNLLTFEGKEHEDAGLLKWTVTGNEKSTSFEVEKSIDGRAFAKIGVVPGMTSSGNTATYSFTDYMLITQNNYYRLKMINTDGKASYSKVVLILEDLSVKNSMRVSPNPARESVQLRFNNMPAGNYMVMMFNTSGQATLKKSINLSNINEIKSIERTPAMAAGTYFIRVINQNSATVSTSSIVLQ